MPAPCTPWLQHLPASVHSLYPLVQALLREACGHWGTPWMGLEEGLVSLQTPGLSEGNTAATDPLPAGRGGDH